MFKGEESGIWVCLPIYKWRAVLFGCGEDRVDSLIISVDSVECDGYAMVGDEGAAGDKSGIGFNVAAGQVEKFRKTRTACLWVGKKADSCACCCGESEHAGSNGSNQNHLAGMSSLVRHRGGLSRLF